VEGDEGGKRPGKRGRCAMGKTIVVGIQDRDGDLKMTIVPDIKRETLHGAIAETVETGSTVHTDDLPLTRALTSLASRTRWSVTARANPPGLAAI
jgi:transposase-like protein